MKWRSLLLLLCPLFCARASAAPVINLPPGFAVEQVATGLYMTIAMVWLPDGRMLFNEFSFDAGNSNWMGRIRAMDHNDNVLPKPVYTTPAYYGLGISGMALDPNFATNQHIYLWVSDADHLHHRLERLHLNLASMEVDEVATVFELTDPIHSDFVEHVHTTHEFGPDGFLYLNLGDALSGELSQNPDVLWGKVFRVDVHQPLPIDVSDASQFIIASGLRNPFGLAIHPTAGTIWVAENGDQDVTSWDELNLILPGRNYGWPRLEGPGVSPEFENPAHAWNRRLAPTEMTFYTGNAYPPEYQNNLFMGDWNEGGLHRFILTGPSHDQFVSEEVLFADFPFDRPLAVAEGPDGYVYFSSHPDPPYDIGRPINSIWRITYSDLPQAVQFH